MRKRNEKIEDCRALQIVNHAVKITVANIHFFELLFDEKHSDEKGMIEFNMVLSLDKKINLLKYNNEKSNPYDQIDNAIMLCEAMDNELKNLKISNISVCVSKYNDLLREKEKIFQIREDLEQIQNGASICVCEIYFRYPFAYFENEKKKEKAAIRTDFIHIPKKNRIGEDIFIYKQVFFEKKGEKIDDIVDVPINCIDPNLEFIGDKNKLEAALNNWIDNSKKKIKKYEEKEKEYFNISDEDILAAIEILKNRRDFIYRHLKHPVLMRVPSDEIEINEKEYKGEIAKTFAWKGAKFHEPKYINKSNKDEEPPYDGYFPYPIHDQQDINESIKILKKYIKEHEINFSNLIEFLS